MPEHYSREFGEAVRAVLRKHGLSLRSQRIRTGIDHMTMKSMADGLTPRLEKVEQFARAFHLDVNMWRVLAGYEPVELQPPSTPAEIVAQGLAAIRREHPELDIRDPAPALVERLSASEAHQLVAGYWRLVEQGRIPSVEAVADWKPESAIVPDDTPKLPAPES